MTVASHAIFRLVEIMARLRDPETGCAWDKEQTFATIAPYTVEEAYEVADAVERNDLGDLRDELGDLLLQVVFHARMAEEMGAFNFEDVANAISDKMIRRHPHVFADASFASVAEQSAAWETIKAEERAKKSGGAAGVLDDVPAGLPALLRAVKLTKRAGRVGFDWPNPAAVLEKLREETAELEAEIVAGDGRSPEQSNLEEMEALWVEAKRAEKA